jgi:HAD superfamily hydrolase (TIGR01490 family)
MKPICFFDMDKTLIAGNSGVSFMRYSLYRGKTTHWQVLKSIVHYLRYRYDFLDMEKAYRDSLRPLAGIREEELMQFCQEWFDEVVRNLIYPEAQDFVLRHRNQGEGVVIISNATTYAVAPLARYLGVPHVLATQLEVRQGLFTGNYIEPLCFRHGKVFWAERLAAALGGEVGRSTFYTDSITDLPLLERVENPRVVNPDPRLRSLARKRGWPVMDFAPRQGGWRKRPKKRGHPQGMPSSRPDKNDGQ